MDYFSKTFWIRISVVVKFEKFSRTKPKKNQTEEQKSHQQKMIASKRKSLSTNKNWQSLNLKIKLQDQKWFVLVDNLITTNFMTK